MASQPNDTPGALSTLDAARAVFGHAGVGMAAISSTGTLLHANPSLLQLFGLEAGALPGTSLASLIDSEDHDALASTLEALAAGGTPVELDVKLAAPGEGADGGDTQRWLRMCLSSEPRAEAAPSSDVSLIVGVIVEITDKRKADLEAQITRKRMEQLFEQANDIIFNIDLQGRFTWGNPVGARLVKRPIEEIIGTSFLEFVRPGYRRAAAAFYQKQIAKRIPSTYYEYPIVAADGEEVWLGQYVQLILEDGKIANIQAVARNITDRKRAEDALRASEERLRAVVSNAPIILWASDRDGVLTMCEGHGLERLGITPDDVVGRKLADVYSDQSGVPVSMDMERALEGATFQKEVPVGDRTFDSWYAPLRDANDDIMGVIGVAVDITDRVQLADRLRDAEKIEAIGRLAGGVAHDFNNQLTAILGFAEMLQQSFDGTDDPRADDVVQILRGGRRAADITEQLLAFGRKQPRRLQVLDLNEVVTNLEPLLLHSVRDDVQLDTELGEGLRPVTADESQIEQVITNLTLNSRDAMPSGGQLTIRTGNASRTAAQMQDHAPLPAGDYVMVSVTDTGDGIDAEAMAHLFEPFFTTKDQGKGTGLGLASAYGIIKQSHGFIEVTSEVGHGSTFAVYLPATAAEAEAAAPVADVDAVVGGSETILFVEDNFAVRDMTASALRGGGYTVLEAGDVSEALKMVLRHDGHIDLLLTDVVMPDRGGRELADTLTATRPDLKVLFITAYPGDESLRGVFDATHELLEKPFGPKHLLKRVRRLLDRTATAAHDTAGQT